MKTRRVWTPGALALAVALAGCGDGATDPDLFGMCAAVVQIQGVLYTPAANVNVPEGYEAAERWGVVEVHDPECNDTVDASEDGGDQGSFTIEDGESNFLPVGTELFTIPGFAPETRLAVRKDGEWIVVLGSS